MRAFREARQASQTSATTAPSEELVTVTTAAAVGGYSTATIRKWISGGQLKSLGSGRNTRVNRAELFRFLEQQAQTKAGRVTDADIDDRAAGLLKGKR